MRLLVLGHNQLQLPGLGRLQTSKHSRSGPVLLKCGLKLGSRHLVDASVVLELAEHVVVLHTRAGAHGKWRTL